MFLTINALLLPGQHIKYEKMEYNDEDDDNRNLH